MQNLKRNNEARPKFAGSYKKKRVHCLSIYIILFVSVNITDNTITTTSAANVLSNEIECD